MMESSSLADLAARSARLLDDGEAVEIRIDGALHRFHALWLRDNAQDDETRSAVNGQRRITLLDIPRDTRIADASWAGDGLSLHFEPDGKVTTFDAGWLLDHAYDKPRPTESCWTGPETTRWDASLSSPREIARYEDVLTDRAARLRWLKAIRRLGFARLRDVPRSDGAPLAIAGLFGYVRETNYGRVFDVRVEADPINLAYTNLGLQPHTDNPYRDPVPGLQILVCLRNEVEGGESIVVDGFEVVRRLLDEWPRGVSLLASHAARFDYAGSPDVRLRSKKPIVELGPDGELLSVRFNNRSAAPFVDIPYDDMADYYRAYRRMAELIEDPELSVRFKLQPGEAFVVDNLRVLHARRAITSGGHRHLQGCYADRDGLLSTIAVLEQQESGM